MCHPRTRAGVEVASDAGGVWCRQLNGLTSVAAKLVAFEGRSEIGLKYCTIFISYMVYISVANFIPFLFYTK